MTTKWTEHVKDFSKQKGITYGEAMKNEECKKIYQSTKKDPKPVKISKNPKVPKIPKEEVKIEEEIVETPKAKKPSKKNKSI